MPARARPQFRPGSACARLVLPHSTPGGFEVPKAMSQANPIRLFVTHLWENSDDYLRVFEYLESARNFFYRNSSKPELRPDGDKEALKEGWRKQIAPVEVVIGLTSLFEVSQDL